MTTPGPTNRRRTSWWSLAAPGGSDDTGDADQPQAAPGGSDDTGDADQSRASRVSGGWVGASEATGRRRYSVHPSWDVLAVMVLVWGVVFGVLVFRRHEHFGSFGFDMGIFDQAVWLAARGKSFITVRGLDLFGHHANVAFFLLAPFSWLGAGPHFLNLFQVAALALSPVPLYLLGRHRGLSPWIALVPSAAFLAHPTTGFLAWELFHPETVAVVFLLCAYLASVHRRWGWYAALLVLAVAWKEDVALAAFFLGLLVAVRGGREGEERRDRRVGAWTMALSLGWFLFVSQVLLGSVNGVGPFYKEFYGDLGGSPLAVVWTAIVHPTEIVDRLATEDARAYVWGLLVPFGPAALAAPLVLLMGVPQVAGNLLSVNTFTRDPIFHYSALPLAALAVASVEGLARVRHDRRLLTGLTALMLLGALVGAVRWGVSPFGERYDEGFWPPTSDPRRETKEAVLALVPGGAAVSATYHFVPHLSRRERIYEYPNPFGDRNWGVHGENRHDPDVVEWIAVDYQTMGAEDRALFESVLASGDFRVVLDRDDIVVARRR